MADVAAGRLIPAIKRYRAATGVGLKDAKDAVEAMAAELAGRPPVRPDPDAETTDGFTAAPSPSDPVAVELFAGRKIQAIKRYRDTTGAGLKDAKEAVEAIEADLRTRMPERFSTAAAGGCLTVLLLVAVPVGLWVAGRAG